MERRYPLLLQPGRMGSIEVDNRVIMAPMGTLNADENGFVTDRTLKFYQEQARGRMGMIIVECTYIDDKLSKGRMDVRVLLPMLRSLGWPGLHQPSTTMV